MSLEDILKEVIPSLEDTEIENYKKALDDLGVAQAADLSLLIPQDMKGIKLIHAMKLKRYSEGISQSSASDHSTASADTILLSPNSSFDTEESTFSPPARTAQEWAWNYNIPWQKLPYSYQNVLDEGKRLSSDARREFVRILSSDVSTFNNRPGLKCLKLVCAKVVDKYPKAFLDVDSTGNKIGCGYGKLLNQVQCRLGNEFKKEYYRNKKTSVASATTDEAPAAEKQDVGEQEAKRKKLQKMHSEASRNGEEVQELMDDTLNLRQKEVLTEQASDLQKLWPYLFTDSTFLKKDFYLLTKAEVKLPKKLPKQIFDFGKITSKYRTPVVQAWQKKTEKEVLSVENLTPYSSAVYPIIIGMLREKEEYILRFYPEGTTTEKIAADTNLPATPIIAVIGSSIFKTGVFEVFFERQQLPYQPDSLEDAIAVCFHLHWVLNIHYNVDVRNFWTFIERFVCSLTSKKKYKAAIGNRLLTFISELQDFITVCED